MIVAIDGPAGSGKSAVGKRVAAALGLPFVDSGLMYRAVAWLAADRGVRYDDAEALTSLARASRITIQGPLVDADGQDLTGHVYSPQASEGASQVAQVGGVREALVLQQRLLGDGGVVMAGRDIGTVVFPDTPHKFFLTASVEERARRRARQIEARGEVADEAALRREVAERDRRDAGRAISPMRPAPDATMVATDGLDLDQVVQAVLDGVRGPR
ncbi:MAG: (d)CMP kinase [Candidatus Dormibacteraeota bacterium]|nr:(d)CMP kinase [Candidatus Dormibacteraeota bacterium]